MNLRKFFFVVPLLLLSVTAHGLGDHQQNKIREKRKVEAYNAKLSRIPIFREKLSGTYRILGPVNGQDLFSKKKDAIIYQMRSQAYKMGANAIMEFKCSQNTKNIFQSCEGFAVIQDEASLPQ